MIETVINVQFCTWALAVSGKFLNKIFYSPLDAENRTFFSSQVAWITNLLLSFESGGLVKIAKNWWIKWHVKENKSILLLWFGLIYLWESKFGCNSAPNNLWSSCVHDSKNSFSSLDLIFYWKRSYCEVYIYYTSLNLDTSFYPTDCVSAPEDRGRLFLSRKIRAT